MSGSISVCCYLFKGITSNDVNKEVATNSTIDWSREFYHMQQLFDNIGMEWQTGNRSGVHQQDPTSQDLQPPIFVTFLKHLVSLDRKSVV